MDHGQWALGTHHTQNQKHLINAMRASADDLMYKSDVISIK